jgi:membrane fusion protein (multidrug efflux system)
MNPRHRLFGIAALAAAAIPAAFYGLRFLQYHWTHVVTDNAYVRADIAQVTPRIPGTLIEIHVEENGPVEAGQLVARLDPAEAEVRLRQAEAALARALEGVREARAAVLGAASRVRAAEAELAQARLDLARAERLASRGVAPTDRLDRARTAFRVAESQLEAARREEERARAALGIPLDAEPTEASMVRQAMAARDEARLLLAYTEIRAPISGFVAKKSVEIGQRVQPGQPLFWIVPLDAVYVEANFKETQLTDVRIGQPATIVADIYPDRVFHGRVASLAPGAGSAFALLPPENASGNWVKVVQRVPVRIVLDEPPPPDRPLRVSLSVVAAIDVRDRSGPLLAPIARRVGPPPAAARTSP